MCALFRWLQHDDTAHEDRAQRITALATADASQGTDVVFRASKVSQQQTPRMQAPGLPRTS